MGNCFHEKKELMIIHKKELDRILEKNADGKFESKQKIKELERSSGSQLKRVNELEGELTKKNPTFIDVKLEKKTADLEKLMQKKDREIKELTESRGDYLKRYNDMA